MSKHNIYKSVILGYGWTNFEVLKMSNDYNLDCSKNNNRLIPFCSVNPRFGKKSTDELERCVSLGAKGIGEIHPSVQKLEMTDYKIWKDTMQIALNSNLPISIHCSEPVGHIYPGKGNVELSKMYEFIIKLVVFPQILFFSGARWATSNRARAPSRPPRMSRKHENIQRF